MIEPVEPPALPEGSSAPPTTPSFDMFVYKLRPDKEGDVLTAQPPEQRRKPDDVHEGLSLGDGGRNVATIFNRESALIQVLNQLEDESATVVEQTYTLEPPTVIESMATWPVSGPGPTTPGESSKHRRTCR